MFDLKDEDLPAEWRRSRCETILTVKNIIIGLVAVISTTSLGLVLTLVFLSPRVLTSEPKAFDERFIDQLKNVEAIVEQSRQTTANLTHDLKQQLRTMEANFAQNRQTTAKLTHDLEQQLNTIEANVAQNRRFLGDSLRYGFRLMKSGVRLHSIQNLCF